MEFTSCEEAFRGGPREEVEPRPMFVSDSSGGAVENLVSVHPHTHAHCTHMSTVSLGHSLPPQPALSEEYLFCSNVPEGRAGCRTWSPSSQHG